MVNTHQWVSMITLRLPLARWAVNARRNEDAKELMQCGAGV